MAAASKSVLMILLLISELSALVLMASTQPDLLSPLLSPIIGNICKRVGCGRGNCKMSENSVFEYKCECDPGWKQSLFDNSTHLNFLPCVIPNCTLNYSCAATPTTQQTPSNTSTNDRGLIVVEVCATKHQSSHINAIVKRDTTISSIILLSPVSMNVQLVGIVPIWAFLWLTDQLQLLPVYLKEAAIKQTRRNTESCRTG
ncbi:uncharacterized protein LOC130816874 isoform X2 [Amaranthus tricolor]|uniref:uncharacterized protein LOC130816874 isoform X2 n=1 Tax=Amaranthus tricolor TaxID=29722 RepID=UPI00258F5259|nr:uncharacterized protein LOC130816874 isoform X2 [Amaranthus tricolor]